MDGITIYICMQTTDLCKLESITAHDVFVFHKASMSDL
jgi:hypothetical protein